MTDKGILLTTLFEEPKLLADARITTIDFMGGTVTLTAERTEGK